LLKTKNFNKITIKDIAAKAGYDRTLFYEYFPSKIDLVRYFFTKVFSEYLAKRDVSVSFPQRLKNFFQHCLEYKETLLLLHRDALMDGALGILNITFYSLPENQNLSFTQQYKMNWHTGGLYNTLLIWIAGGMEKSPDELAALYAEQNPSLGVDKAYIWI
jgi:AcrR family transcriptional regulator